MVSSGRMIIQGPMDYKRKGSGNGFAGCVARGLIQAGVRADDPASISDGRRRETVPPPLRITIVNAGYGSTNYWVVSAGSSRLLVDLGYPGTMGIMRAALL